YVPMDPDYPAERLVYMAGDAEVAMLLLSRRHAGGSPRVNLKQVWIDAEWETISQEETNNLGVAGDGENLADMIYTSGSTGNPKGVAIQHGGLSNLIQWHQRRYGITREDRSTLLARVGFDASVWELWPYICAGATVVIPRREIRGSTSELAT